MRIGIMPFTGALTEGVNKVKSDNNIHAYFND